MPDAGEGLTEAEIIGWRVAVGDTVTVNQIIVEIETAKAAVELPSPYTGRVQELLVQPGVTVEVGTPIITIDTGPDTDTRPAAAAEPTGAAEPAGSKIGEVTADGRIATLVGYVAAGTSGRRRPRRGAPTADAQAPTPAPEQPAADVAAPAGVSAEVAAVPRSAAAPLSTPPVRKFAKDLGIDLRSVHASRSDGVITREDVAHEAAVRGAAHPSPVPAAPAASASAPAAAAPSAGREHRIPVTGVRKATAAAMVASAFTVPHVTEFLTVDVTRLLELRDRLRARPQFEGVAVTPLAFVARAVCLAARRTPEVNAVYETDPAGDGRDQILVKDYLHLGIAAATERGLIVPVIHDADAMNLAQLADALTELTATARAGHTGLAQLTGGTFTITNVGVFGIDTGTPIINPGQAAILAVGTIRDAPWVVDGQLAVRKICQLALSFDHRVIDGQQGSQFLADVGALLADPGLALAW